MAHGGKTDVADRHKAAGAKSLGRHGGTVWAQDKLWLRRKNTAILVQQNFGHTSGP